MNGRTMVYIKFFNRAVTASVKHYPFVIPSCSCYKISQIKDKNIRYLCTSGVLLAGHSKWQNIRHIKGAKDLERSQIFSRIVKNMKIAVKEGGGINPKLNSKLARIIDQAKQANMPLSTIENSLKAMEKSIENAKPSSITFGAPGGIFIVVDVITDNAARTRQELNSILKKANFKEQRSVEGVFDEKGMIITKGDFDKALDHAIEVGAEDVTEEDGFLTFVCDPKDFFQVKQRIEDLKYEMDYSGLEKIPHMIAPVKENDMPKFKTAFERLEERDDVMKLHCNFELS